MLTAAGKTIEIFTRILFLLEPGPALKVRRQILLLPERTCWRPVPLEKLSVLVWPLYSTCSAINLLEYLMQNEKQG